MIAARGFLPLIDEGDKRRCGICRRRVHKDEIVGKGCLICGGYVNADDHVQDGVV